jgi:hypothetical protein
MKVRSPFFVLPIHAARSGHGDGRQVETGLWFSSRLVWLPQIRFGHSWLLRERLNRVGFTLHNAIGVTHSHRCYTKTRNVLAALQQIIPQHCAHGRVYAFDSQSLDGKMSFPIRDKWERPVNFHVAVLLSRRSGSEQMS